MHECTQVRTKNENVSMPVETKPRDYKCWHSTKQDIKLELYILPQVFWPYAGSRL